MPSYLSKLSTLLTFQIFIFHLSLCITINNASRNTPTHYKKMYVTRPLSLYKRNPSALSSPPPEGPNSGILIIQDEEAEPTCCFGLFKSDQVKDLPFPQNKNLRVSYTTSRGAGNNRMNHTSINRVIFIPVLNQPLSSNQHYVIERRGRHKGYAYSHKLQFLFDLYIYILSEDAVLENQILFAGLLDMILLNESVH